MYIGTNEIIFTIITLLSIFIACFVFFRKDVTRKPEQREFEPDFTKMVGFEYIDKTRDYLDYLEEHLTNIHKAFLNISEACKEMAWVCDDCSWFTLRQEVLEHDLSKFSAREFVQYRQKFYPVDGEVIDKEDFKLAWKHHLLDNLHHWESIVSEKDIIHMIIDWTAMGYKFGDTAQEYYESNKDTIKINPTYIPLMYEIFKRIKIHNDSIKEDDEA